ncbi:MAG: nucleotidyltransferase domain-containing protein [Candidatus Korarchaeum sp.]
MEYEGVLKRLVDYAERAVARGAKAVILVGSLARGDYTAFSDADIIIISDEVPENPIRRISDFMDPSLPVDVEPLVLTTEEFLKMAKEGRRIVREAIFYGKLLFGDPEIIKAASRYLESEDGSSERWEGE